ncbi:MAG: hypothetical protein JO243_08085 [Solirubrobacterales bacterium]|nr:hypothetical protein [Solirubrobacterales bacterium]
MSLDVFGRAWLAALVPGPGLRHRLAAGLIAAMAVLLATAAAASAYTPTTIITNGPWSPNPCCGARHPGWYKDAFGIVHLEGAVSQLVNPGGPTLITTLPPAARPNRSVFEIVHTFGGTYADISIDTQGRVGIIAPRPPEKFDPSFVSLEGISYQPNNQIPVNPISINQANWVQNWGRQGPTNPNKSFGASNPGWYKDGSGIVHLEGATRQTNALGSSAPLIGTLPPAAKPARDVIVLAHTFNGTYTQLQIDTDGRIFYGGTRAPGTSDSSFVSLEGISFSPGALFSHMSQFNSTDWSRCFGNQDPGWVEDGAAIVRLEGCAAQHTTTSSPDPNLIGSVPQVVAPNQTVYEVVEAGAGEYADVAISPDGHIRVVGTPPAQGVLSILNLENITYQINDAPGPHALSLTRNGDVLALLHQPRTLELAVFSLGAHAHQLGTVRLGPAPAGRSRFHWNLSVAGHRLARGAYIAELLAIPAHGRAIAGGPGVTFALTGKGRLRVLSSTCSVGSALSHRC